MKAVVKFFILSLTFFFSSSGFSQISGIVFRDYNANGTRQTGSTYNEDGVINVTVKAYNSANIEVGSVVTSSTGAYSFTGLSLPVRIEFIPPLTDDYSGVVGTGSQSSVQFHNATTTTANFGINYPDQYCHTTNPNIITTCFVNGRPAPGTSQTDVIVRHPYSATGNSYGTNNTYLGDAGTVGAVWGVAYNRETGDIFTSALAKRHAAMIDNDGNGVEDLGAIYIKTTAGTPTLWLDLATVPGVDVGLSVMPTISTRGLPNSNMGPSYDSAMFGLVGKIGLGDIEISDDNTTLYVVSLYDKKLYTIDIASKTLIGAGIPVPNPCSGGFARPFSVTYHRG
ncbi:MAG TPA: SdrD B-like domain-containing protein, partial [Saprospiraceae bacterium]|nr:SdrD B-like domain-containing protein [Saprospiraceae bacterium]